MTRRIIIRLALPCLLVFVAAGCAGLPLPVEKPDVSPRAVRVATASAFGARGELDLDVYNPNGFGLPLKAIEYELAIGGARAVSGEAALDALIPARGNAPVTVGLELGTLNAIHAGRRLASGRRDYRLTGTAVFASRIGDVRVAFSQDGTLGR